MGNRLELHEELCEILGSRNVYFQPPENIKMMYPAMVYSLESPDLRHADDNRYLMKRKYDLKYIDRNPDSSVPELILDNFKYCRMGSPYVADNLNHYPFDLYY